MMYFMQRYAKASGQLLVNKVVKTYEKLQYKKAIRVSETSLKAKKYDVTARQPNWRCKLKEIKDLLSLSRICVVSSHLWLVWSL